MPAYVKFGHGFEVGILNFLYGLVIEYLLVQKTIKDKITAVPVVPDCR